MSNYANPASLVSTQWVADHLADPTVRLVEASWGDDEYRSGHISGAVYWSFAEDLKKPELSDAPDADAMAVLLSRAGIEAATTIVLYGNLSNLVERGFDRSHVDAGGRQLFGKQFICSPLRCHLGSPSSVGWRFQVAALRCTSVALQAMNLYTAQPGPPLHGQ